MILMKECYEGLVMDIDDNIVVVIYDVEGEILEQTYEYKQFQKLPELGDRVRVQVTVVKLEGEICQEKSWQKKSVRNTELTLQKAIASYLL